MTRGGAGNQKGIALLIVLAALSGISLAAILAAGNSARILGETMVVRDNVIARQAEMAALDMFGARLSLPAGASGFRLNLGRASVDVQVKSEAGKLDLNLADEATLARFFSAILGDPDRGVRMAAAVADWRDADGLTRLNGAEADDYRALGRSQGPMNGPFESVQDLISVLGVDDPLFLCVRPFMSVHAGAQIPDARFAASTVLRALGLTAQQTPDSASVIGALGARSGDVYELTTIIAVRGERPKPAIAYVVRALGNPRQPLAILDRQPAGDWERQSRDGCATLGGQERGSP